MKWHFSQNLPLAISTFLELEIGSDWTFMQNKIKICVTNVWDIEKMWNFANLKIAHNLSYSFFNMICALNAIDPYKSTKNFSMGCMAVKWVFSKTSFYNLGEGRCHWACLFISKRTWWVCTKICIKCAGSISRLKLFYWLFIFLVL